MATRHEPDAASRYLVETAAAFCTQEQVARLLKVSVSCLKSHYPDELEVGKAQKTLAVAKNVFRIATEGEDKVAANVGMWWLERFGGEMYRSPDKRVSVDLNVREAPPVIDSSKLTFEQRAQLRGIIEACITVPAELPALEHQGDTDGASE